MFNLRPENAEDERKHYDEAKRGPRGELYGVKGQFSIAKIANNIDELGHGKGFSLDAASKNSDTFELLQVVAIGEATP